MYSNISQVAKAVTFDPFNNKEMFPRERNIYSSLSIPINNFIYVDHISLYALHRVSWITPKAFPILLSAKQMFLQNRYSRNISIFESQDKLQYELD